MPRSIEIGWYEVDVYKHLTSTRMKGFICTLRIWAKSRKDMEKKLRKLHISNYQYPIYIGDNY